jgi:hypothetical protein
MKVILPKMGKIQNVPQQKRITIFFENDSNNFDYISVRRKLP